PVEESSAPLQVDSPIVVDSHTNIEKVPPDYSRQIFDSVIKDVSNPLPMGHIPIKSIVVALPIAVDAGNQEWTVVDRKKKGNSKSKSPTISEK
ncbi:hypothetical protein KI387_010707, partial [Taxus chinensis]